MNGRLLLLFSVLLAGACVPAETPPQLSATAGPAVVMLDDRYVNAEFSAAHPHGWRVITSPADVPPFVIFAAPDNCALIVLSVTPQDVPEPDAACEGGDMLTEMQILEGERVTVYAVGVALEHQWPVFGPVFERVVASVEMEAENHASIHETRFSG